MLTSHGPLQDVREDRDVVAVLRGFRAGRVLDGDVADVAIGCFRKRVAEDLRTPDGVLVGLGLFFRIVGVGQTERQAGSDRKCQSDVDRKCQSDGSRLGRNSMIVTPHEFAEMQIAEAVARFKVLIRRRRAENRYLFFSRREARLTLWVSPFRDPPASSAPGRDQAMRRRNSSSLSRRRCPPG